MKMEKFEDLVRKSFESSASEFDHQIIWENIEPQLKKKKKRRLVFFWWFFGLGLLGYFFALSGKVGNSRISQVAQSALLSSQSVSQCELVFDGLMEKEKPREINKIGTKAETIETSLAYKQQSTIVSTRSTDYLHQKSMIADARIDAITSESGSIAVESSKQTGLEGSSHTAILALDQTKDQNINSVESQLLEPETVHSVDSVANLEGIALADKIQNSQLVPAAASKAKKNTKETPSKAQLKKWQRKVSKVEIALEGGPAIGLHRFGYHFQPDINNRRYLAQRKASESVRLGYESKATFAAVLRSGLVLRAGLQYRVNRELFQFSQASTKNEWITAPISITVDAAGNTIRSVEGNVLRTTITETRIKQNNYYKYLGLPIELGIRRGNKHNTWELTGGAELNLIFRASGKVFTPSSTSISISDTYTLQQKYFRTQTGLGLSSGFAIGHEINKRLTLRLGTQAIFPLKSVSETDYILSQRYIHFNVMTGIVYTIYDARKMKKSTKRLPKLGK